MKNIFFLFFLCIPLAFANAQEFDKQIDNAKSAYEAGNYEDSRLAVQNARAAGQNHVQEYGGECALRPQDAHL